MVVATDIDDGTGADDMPLFDLFPYPETESHLPDERQEESPDGLKTSLDFVFGSRRVQWLDPDGDIIATRLWRSGLLAASQVHRGSFLDLTKGACPSLDVCGRDVLEIGCGCGLAGVIAGLHGARSVTLTDCDNRALVRLGMHLEELLLAGGGCKRRPSSREDRETLECEYGADFRNCYLFPRTGQRPDASTEQEQQHGSDQSCESEGGTSTVPPGRRKPAGAAQGSACREFRLRHQLWEQDEVDNAAELLEADHLAAARAETDGPEPKSRPIGHWSNAHRLPENRFAQVLGTGEKFDVIIASDCLYFPSQESPLVAVLTRRLRASPGSMAMVIVQTRSSGGFQVVRFVESLERAGFQVRHVDQSGTSCKHEDHGWDYADMSHKHVHYHHRGGAAKEEGPERPARHGRGVESEEAGPHREPHMEATGKEVAEHILFVSWRSCQAAPQGARLP